MELHKLEMNQIKTLDPKAMREVEKDVRKGLTKIRMDIYTSKSAQGAKVRGLKKSLARLLTVQNQAKLTQSAVNGSKAKKTK